MSFYDPYADVGYEDPYADPFATMAAGDPQMQAMLAIMANADPAYANANMPTFEMGELAAMSNMVPDFQPNGKPLTVANQTSALNAYRTGMFDPLFQGLGGTAGFAANAFEPTVTTEIVQTPELQQIYGYLRSPDSVEGFIADEIMNGGTSSTAVRKLRQLLADPATDPTLRDNLLLELPQVPVEYGMPTPELAVENVNWDRDDNSVSSRARTIGETFAQIPRVGPSGPQWDPNTGQQISAGGELQWSTDETGAPVMVEVTSTPSPMAEKFTTAGLPLPTDEYTVADFAPQAAEMQGVLASGAFDQPVDEAMARFLAGNQPTFNPVSAQTRAAAAAEPPVQPPAEPMWETSLADMMTHNPQGDTSGVWNSLKNQGIWDILTGNEGAGQPGGGPGLLAEGSPLNYGGGLADIITQNPSGDTGGVWNSLKNQGLIDIITGNEAPGSPSLTPEQLAARAATMGPPAPGSGLLADAQNFVANGPPTSPLPPYAQPGAQPARQPGGPGYQNAATLPVYAQPGAQPARQPGGLGFQQAVPAMVRLITGETPTSAPQSEQTGRGITTGEPARRPMHEMEGEDRAVQLERGGITQGRNRRSLDQWHAALGQRNAAMQQAFGPEAGYAAAQVMRMGEAGVRPLDQALMARRLVLMSAGMPNSGYIPGT